MGEKKVSTKKQYNTELDDMSHLLHVQVLASDVNIGYEEIVNTQVHQVNGKPVKNLSDLTRQIEGCQDQYLRFDLEYNQVRGALSQICHAAFNVRRCHVLRKKC